MSCLVIVSLVSVTRPFVPGRPRPGPALAASRFVSFLPGSMA